MNEKVLDWFKFWESWSNFQPKQKEAEEAVSKYDYVLYGGAAGGGKSYFLRKFPIKFLVACYKQLGLRGVRAGLFCEDYPALWDRHINRIPYEFPKELGEYKAQTHEFVLNQSLGSGVISFRNLDDPSKYMSSEFAIILWDEVTKKTKETFDFLRLRKRWPGIKRTKFVGGTNPGEIGHEWVKKLWIDKRFDRDEAEKDQFHFISAKATDNKYLNQNYYSILDSLPEGMRNAYRDGSWDIFAGQYFGEWLKDKHVFDPGFEFPDGLPSSWKRYRAYDHGREAPACCLWFAVDQDGRVWVYRELYIKGWDVDQIAAEIVKLSKGETYEYSVSDPAIFSRMGFVDKYGGQTIAESFARQGVVFYPASNRRKDGWEVMHRYLRWEKDVRPKMLFSNLCYNAIRTIPTLVHDKNRIEDLDSEGEDHAADAVRYFLMSLHERTSARPLNQIEQKLKFFREQREHTFNNLNLGSYYED